MTKEEIEKKEKELKELQEKLEKERKELAEKTGKEDDSWLKELPESAQNEIKKLREENKERRLKSKELEEKLKSQDDRFATLEGGLKTALGIKEDDAKPEDKIKELQLAAAQAQERAMMLEICNDYGVLGAEAQNFFNYLIDKTEFPEGDSAEAKSSRDNILKDLAKQANAVGGNTKTHRTSTGGTKQPASEDDPNDKGGGGGTHKTYTLEEFKAMGPHGQSELFNKDRKQYDKLFDQVEAERLAKKEKMRNWRG